jgi:formylglycine-generating enzyme required for sulfatase activity
VADLYPGALHVRAKVWNPALPGIDQPVERQAEITVGSFKPNGFGLYDIIGNVWKWAQDCWNRPYKGAPGDGSAWESGDCARRVVRGGSSSGIPVNAHVADRFRVAPANRSATGVSLSPGRSDPLGLDLSTS